VCVTLLGGFRLWSAGEEVAVPLTAQRVLAFVALQDGPVRRSHVGSMLWLDTPEAHAAASLRSALWKLRRVGCELIDSAGGSLQLSPAVSVDFRAAATLARWAVAAPPSWDPAGSDSALLSDDLLPTWYDEWVLAERERFRQLRLHALESICARLTTLGRHGMAVQAGLLAVAADPLRESAQTALIQAFLAEGNVSEARRQFEEFQKVLRAELDLDPSDALRALVGC
jgi:DNA-binding SARP family transcriptional activator